MASLYTHRDSNIRKTWFIFAIFLIVVIGAGYVFSRAYGRPEILYAAIIVSVLMNIWAYWFSDKTVLRMARAHPVTRESHRELYNIVENLSITAGLPMPRLYITDDAQLNAFATGRNPKHAVIVVTIGLLAHLNRSELEGVLSHELSHIGNRDILVSGIIVILAGVIAILSDTFLRTMRFRQFGRRREAGDLFILLGFIFALLAPLSALLMRLAISRRRESLADASGALLTRYPEGLASALAKISDDKTPMPAANNTTAHLWIDDPFNRDIKTSFLHRMFMTHPPIGERIRALRGMGVK